jgi:DNA-binding MarR family transcriptional regulator
MAEEVDGQTVVWTTVVQRPIMRGMSQVSARTRRRFDSLQQEAYLNLWRTYDRLRAHEDALFSQYELTAQQYNALRLLQASRPGGLRTLEIAARLVSRAPDITRLLDRLEERGLVSRERLADNRRVVEVTLTAAGNKLLESLTEPLAQCHAAQLGHLKGAELRSLVALLKAARAPHETKGSDWE